MKNILITGAGGALGKACVMEFIKKGHHVIALLSPGKKLPYETPAPVSVYNADLMNEDNTLEVVDQIITDHTSIDVALLLVGGFAMGSLDNTGGAMIKKMIGLNFDTTYYTGSKVFNQMITQPNGGRIVMVGAKPALEPIAATSKVAYALSKSLIFKLAEIFNEIGKDNNVVSTVIVPSIINTEDNRKAMPKADTAAWVQPEEIAAIVAFATSDQGATLREPIIKIYGKS